MCDTCIPAGKVQSKILRVKDLERRGGERERQALRKGTKRRRDRGKETERDRERQRETERKRGREAERRRDRETARHSDSVTEKQFNFS